MENLLYSWLFDLAESSPKTLWVAISSDSYTWNSAKKHAYQDKNSVKWETLSAVNAGQCSIL
jgi:hypothetical protein